MTDAAFVTNLVREADHLSDFAGAFARLFGFELSHFEEALESWQEANEMLARVKAATDPMDRFEAWQVLSGWTGWKRSIVQNAVGQEEFQNLSSQIVSLSPDKPLGQIAHEIYLEAGTKALEKIPDSSARYNEIRSRLSELDQQAKKILTDLQERYEDEKDRIKKKSGHKDLLERKNAILLVFCDTREHLYKAHRQGDFTLDELKRRLDEVNVEESRELDPIWKKLHSISERIDQLMNDNMRARGEALKDVDAEKIRLIDESAQIEKEFFASVINAVLEKSEVSPEEAAAWAEKQEFSDAARRRLEKIGYPVERVRQDMAEFYRAVNGRLGKVDLGATRGNRASARIGAGEVKMTGRFTKTTLWHEMGHLLERHQRLYRLSNHFLDTRTGRQQGTRPKSLRVLTGIKSYKADEKAYPDDFIDPYVGKCYQNGTTEVFSMGFQHFASPAEAAALFSRDPEMFRLMVGIMCTPMGEIERENIGKVIQAVEKKKTREAVVKEFFKTLEKKSKGIETMVEGTIFRLQQQDRWGQKRPDFYTVECQKNGAWKWLATFKSIKAARMFLYLIVYVTEVSGVDRARQLVADLMDVQRGKIPYGIFDQENPVVPDIHPDSIPKSIQEAA